MVHKSRESKCIFHGSRKNRKPVSRGRKDRDSRITEKKILIHASRKEKTPIHAPRKKYRGPSFVCTFFFSREPRPPSQIYRQIYGKLEK